MMESSFRRCFRIALVLLIAACSAAPPPAARPSGPGRSRALPPQLPDSGGWGTHVLALRQDSAGRLWAGTYGDGIYVLEPRPDEESEPQAGEPEQPRGPRWRRIIADTGSISWNYVNALGFTRSGAVWYGTVGNGFGVSADSGRTWRNWTFDELGPRWQYVAPNGIDTRGDTVFIATADGLRITSDGGARWTCVVASAGTAEPDASCAERIAALSNEYLLALDVDARGRVWVGSLAGVSMSPDGGRTWRTLGEEVGLPAERVRALVMNMDSTVWVATETAVYVDSTRSEDEFEFRQATIRPPGFSQLPGAVRAMIPSPGRLPPTFALSYGMVAGDTETGNFRVYHLAGAEIYRPVADLWAVQWWGPPLWPIAGATTGLNLTLAGDYRPENAYAAERVVETQDPAHVWFQRPIDPDSGNPYIDATYRYGSTMGGNFQTHQGVEFNNPRGTPVRAIGPGVVVYAGGAEEGSRTVAIRHDRDWEGRSIFSTYYHNSAIEVAAGDRVQAGQTIARVGNTGRATNHHLHLEVHVAPGQDSAAIVNPEERFPPHTVNPQLWIESLPGTGIVAGRVLDAAGRPIQGARIHGLVLPYPVETPFSFAETYGDRAHADPHWAENFAVGDVPAGTYLLGVDIGEERVWRRVRVDAGRLTFVEFRPG